jgi:hypothetical protein
MVTVGRGDVDLFTVTVAFWDMPWLFVIVSTYIVSPNGSRSEATVTVALLNCCVSSVCTGSQFAWQVSEE